MFMWVGKVHSGHSKGQIAILIYLGFAYCIHCVLSDHFLGIPIVKITTLNYRTLQNGGNSQVNCVPGVLYSQLYMYTTFHDKELNTLLK